jgi:phytoene/squalene synthetase
LAGDVASFNSKDAPLLLGVRFEDSAKAPAEGRDGTHLAGGSLVVSRRIAQRFHAPIDGFYRLALLADAIAGTPDLAAEQKSARIAALKSALEGREETTPQDGSADMGAAFLEPAHALRRLCAEGAIAALHGRLVLEACQLEAVKDRFRDWSDLRSYLGFKAAPAARFVFELHGEARSGLAPAEALCMASHLVHLLNNCRRDYLDHGRVYLPQSWFTGADARAGALGGREATPELHAVFDQARAAIDGLLRTAAPVVRSIGDRGLRMEAALMLSRTERLAAKLALRDPLRQAVTLSGLERLGAGIGGAIRAYLGR